MKKIIFLMICVTVAGCTHRVPMSSDVTKSETPPYSFILSVATSQQILIIPDVEKLGDIRQHWTRYTVMDFEEDVKRAVAAADQRLTLSEIENLVFRTLHVHPLGKGPGGPIPFRIGDYSTVQIISPQ